MGILRDAIAQRRDQRSIYDPNQVGQQQRGRLLPSLSEYMPTPAAGSGDRSSRRARRHGSSRANYQEQEYVMPSSSPLTYYPLAPSEDDQRRWSTPVQPYPPSQYQTAQYPASQYPASQYPAANYPAARCPPSQYATPAPAFNSFTTNLAPPPLPARRQAVSTRPSTISPNDPDPYRVPPPSYSSADYLEYQDSTAVLPLAIPQADYGATSPFLRAYSDELLGSRGISQAKFIAWVDAYNIASTPSAELQLVGKAAGIAGYFVPGAAGLIPTAVQIGAGLGGYATKKSAVAECLARGNVELFNPAQLQVITPELENNIGFTRVNTSYTDPNRLQHDIPSRLQQYATYLSPLSVILPPAVPPKSTNSHVSGWGASLSERDRVKALDKARKDAGKGKSRRSDKLEADLKWLLVVPCD